MRSRKSKGRQKPTIRNSPRDPGSHSVSVSAFKGPIPPPATLEGYKRIVSTAPERIIRMAERSQNQHHKFIENQGLLQRRGQWFGFAAIAIIAAIACVAMYMNYPWIASVAVLAVIAPIVKNTLRH